MRINPKKYEVAQGQRLCCVQCGRTCRTRTGTVARVYVTLKFTFKPTTEVYSVRNTPMIICRMCFIRKGGLRFNSIGGMRLYDSLSGQPYDQYGYQMWQFETDDPWKVEAK